MEVTESAGTGDEMTHSNHQSEISGKKKTKTRDLMTPKLYNSQSRLRIGSCSHRARLSWENTGITGDCNVLFVQYMIVGPCHDAGDGSCRHKV